MAIYMWREYNPPELCFTANTAGSTVSLYKVWWPTSLSLVTSTDWVHRIPYSYYDTITLSNVWDKVYFRNTSESNHSCNNDANNNNYFVMSWSIAASWNLNYLINKNWEDFTNSYGICNMFQWCTALTTPPELPTKVLTNYCYSNLFQWCTNLTKAPTLPATSLEQYCYNNMFYWCSNLEELPKITQTALEYRCFYTMFAGCSKIKLSETQTWEYQTPYRIPETWTWVDGWQSLSSMFYQTWWTFTWTPNINTTYYTSNTIV